MLPQLFNYEGQQVRTVHKDGETWFIAQDVCYILGLGQVSRAMDRLDDDECTLLEVIHPQSTVAYMRMNGVNESGLYQLILGSNKPEAKAFKRWITHEVIPSIRKTGSYSTQLTPAEALLQSVQLLAKQERELSEVKQAQDQSRAVLIEHEYALSVLDQKVRDEIRLDNREQKQVQGAVNSRARAIGLPDAYRQIYGSLKRHFMVPSYRDLKRSDITKAFEFIRCWSPRVQ